jgi:tetratricopeptide (TPR) repeat protein
MALQLGEFAEAEQVLRPLAQTEQNPKLGALIQSLLGSVLLEQSRYEEAMQCFQASFRLWPERGSTHRAIAETLLRRGGDSREALRWARVAVQKEKSGPGLSSDSKAINLGEELATLAWAVAAHTRDATEVERLSEEVSMPALTPRSTQALAFYHFGLAWTELGNSPKSAAYFEHAARLDPNGIWGKAAAARAVATNHA